MADFFFYEYATIGLQTHKVAIMNRKASIGHPMSHPMEFLPGKMRFDRSLHKGDGALSVAAGSGNLEMVQWLDEHGAPVANAMDRAAGSNHLVVIIW